MDRSEETDEPSNAPAFQDFLVDFNEPTVSGPNRSIGNGISSPGHNNSSAPWLPSARPSAFLSYRGASTSRVSQVSSFEHSVGPSASPTASNGVFSNPNRSIFTSGQPTSSISVNTVHASMSPPPPARESRPLAALSVSNTSATRRPTPQALQPPVSSSHNSGRASVEKDADDPTVSMDESSSTRKAPRTSMALSQLFTEDAGSPAVSRHGSYLRTLSGTQFTKSHPHDPTTLGPHVYGQGLIGGKFSDITVNAFGTSYKLHRLLLDRTPFFSTAFSGPWLEANSKEMQLDPSDVDPNITQAAFELALKRIYGCEDPDEEYQEAIGLFAVACWLEMDDLLEASIENLLIQMTPAKLSTYIRFVTGNYYGTAGARILISAKAMLCRDGWQMKLRNWDGIPAEIVREIVGGDGLFVTGEWERWVLAVRILNRRLKSLARDAGLLDESGAVRQAPRHLCIAAPRYGKSNRVDLDPSRPWQAFYVDPEVAPLLILLDEGINYVHLSFEELQHMRNERDVFGMPILPEKVISAALWMQMELRQRIVNADESDLELGFAQNLSSMDTTLAVAAQNLELSEKAAQPRSIIPDSLPDTEGNADGDINDRTHLAEIAGKRPELETNSRDSLERSDTPGSNEEESRKFWIPTIDATFAVGGVDARSTGSRHSQASRGSRNSPAQPEELHWTGDMSLLSNGPNDNLLNDSQILHRISRSPATPKVATFPGPRTAYTDFPPFRFSVEFPAAATLKENKRLYSNTLWYAGSLWNVYIQKKDSAKGLQLGVYLHREKQSDNVDIVLANYTGHSVDERIGRLEREFDRRRRGGRRQPGDEDVDTVLSDTQTDLDTMSGTLRRPARRPTKFTSQSKSSSNANQPLTSFPRPWDTDLDGSANLTSEPDTDEETTSRPISHLIAARKKSRLPALPPYIDGRPTIQTYFKIYTPSKDGRLLTVYESKPDRFNFSQSWGWKSSSLDLEGSLNGDSGRAAKDRRLRFMFVLGTV